MKVFEIDNHIRMAVGNCMAAGKAFALTLLPGKKEAMFFAADRIRKPTAGDTGFVIAPFSKSGDSKPMIICDELSIEEASNMEVSSKRVTDRMPIPVATDKADYMSAVNTLVSTLTGREAKVVYSRVDTVDSAAGPLEVAERYFNALPDCMRALYHTPEMGLWIVATPEILIDSNEAGELQTMSLAGTRCVSSEPWDEKNLKEHELVTRYIVDTLGRCGLTSLVHSAENLGFGAIEHLCNRISAHGDASPLEVAMALSPTPAVCGWPVEEAYDTIRKLEKHDRECYGGFIGVVSPSESHLHVNLRCCKVMESSSRNRRYILYAGGGINSLSNPGAEWEESENKLSRLRDIIISNPS